MRQMKYATASLMCALSVFWSVGSVEGSGNEAVQATLAAYKLPGIMVAAADEMALESFSEESSSEESSSEESSSEESSESQPEIYQTVAEPSVDVEALTTEEKEIIYEQEDQVVGGGSSGSGVPEDTVLPDPGDSGSSDEPADPSEPVVKAGWVTEDGKTYYYSNNEPLKGHQVMNNGKRYYFNGEGVYSSKVCIDISHHQGDLSQEVWNSFKADGVDMVILRCGYRGSVIPTLRDDTQFENNYARARAAGLEVGVYFYSQATNATEAAEEARFVLAKISGKAIVTSVIDIEYQSWNPDRGDTEPRANSISAAARTDVAVTFCDMMKSSGYSTMVYSSATWFDLGRGYYDGRINNYVKWIADWRNGYTYDSSSCKIWQYTDSGKVNGYKGNVDMNIWFN